MMFSGSLLGTKKKGGPVSYFRDLSSQNCGGPLQQRNKINGLQQPPKKSKVLRVFASGVPRCTLYDFTFHTIIEKSKYERLKQSI